MEWRMWWVHTPKTGSSFCLTLQHLWCPDTWPGNGNRSVPETAIYDHKGCTHVKNFTCPEKTVGHDFVPVGWPRGDTARAVIVLRDQWTRIVSSFSDGKHHSGMPERYFNEVFRPSLQETAKAECHGDGTTARFRRSNAYNDCVRLAEFEAYANAPEMKGCVAKTLTGRGCSAVNATLAPADVTLAIERLGTFAYVGIFEDWTEMVYSLHDTLGHGRGTVGPLDFVHMRSTKNKLAVPAALKAAYADPWDQPIYDAALGLYCGTFRTGDASAFPPCRRRSSLGTSEP